MPLLVTDLIAKESLSIRAAGTSEGVKRAWDSRGRGRKAKPSAGVRKAKPEVSKDTFDDREKRFQEHKKLKAEYARIGKRLDAMNRKLEKAEDVKSFAGKVLHFLKRVGDWAESAGSLKELVMGAIGVLWYTLHSVHSMSHHIQNATMWAMNHIAPILYQSSVFSL